jgi:hypothetical protein
MVISHNAPSGGASANGKRTKPRTSITPQQLEILKQAYVREQRPTKQTREELMAKTGLDMKVHGVCKTCVHVCVYACVYLSVSIR